VLFYFTEREGQHPKNHASWIQTYKLCTWLHTNSVGPQPQHLGHNTTCGSEQPIYKNSWRWTCKCPKHVEAFYENKIIVNCCIKSVHLLTYIYDARSHLHQIYHLRIKNHFLSHWNFKWSAIYASYLRGSRFITPYAVRLLLNVAVFIFFWCLQII